MTDDNEGMRMTVREWTAARIVLIGGFVIAIAVAGYFTWTQHQQAVQAAAAQQAQEQAAEKAAAGPTPAQIADAQARIGLAVCLRVAINAAADGIIPQYSKLDSKSPTPTGVQGRYTCTAATDVAKYKVTGDLLCSDMRKASCVKLYSVISDDGTVLYQSKD